MRARNRAKEAFEKANPDFGKRVKRHLQSQPPPGDKAWKQYIVQHQAELWAGLVDASENYERLKT